MSAELYYFDNAATSFPKPKSVVREVARCLDSYCGNAGRGSHRLSLEAANKIYECREEICALFNAPSPESIAFGPSCSYGLNLIIKGALMQGDHVLISDMEHNSVWRPIKKLAREGKITFDIFSALSKAGQSDEELLAEIKSKLKRNTKLLICNHQSNICSFSLPIEKIGKLCRENHVLFALDAAQSAGHIAIDVKKMNIDYMSVPGHKGLYGPQGSAFVIINSPHTLDTLIEGGNGIFSLSSDMPELLPERFEVGTLPTPAIAGLCEGIKEVQMRGIESISQSEAALFARLRDGLLNIGGAHVYLPQFCGNTLLFNLPGISAERASSLLDSEGFCLRGGFHCSALAHNSLGTQNTGGIRASFGMFNTMRDVDRLLTACQSITAFR